MPSKMVSYQHTNHFSRSKTNSFRRTILIVPIYHMAAFQTAQPLTSPPFPLMAPLQIVLPLKESQFPSETAGEGNLTLLISSLDGDQFFRVETHGHAASVFTTRQSDQNPPSDYMVRQFAKPFARHPCAGRGLDGLGRSWPVEIPAFAGMTVTSNGLRVKTQST